MQQNSRLPDDRIEYFMQIETEMTDGFQHARGGGLLFKGTREFVVAHGKLLLRARDFKRVHRLCSEGLQQGGIVGFKGAYLFADHDDSTVTGRRTQGDSQCGTNADRFQCLQKLLRHFVFDPAMQTQVVNEIIDRNGDAIPYRLRNRPDAVRFDVTVVVRIQFDSRRCFNPQVFPFECEQITCVGIRESSCGGTDFDQGPRKIERVGIDSPDYP